MSISTGKRSRLAASAIIAEALNSIVREMRRSIVRSSYSSIIYEGYDFSCVLLDGKGRLIAESGEDHPFHIIPVAGAVAGARQVHETIGPDEILLHNDPYTGGTHLNDVAVIWPVYIDRECTFHIVVRSHWGDIGGMSPGSLNGAATEIVQEGLRLNYLKIPRESASEVLRVIFDNVRSSREATLDFQTVLGICKVAESRLNRLAGKYGMDAIGGGIEDTLAKSEKRFRAAIRNLPRGAYRHTAYLDGNSMTPHPLAVTVLLDISEAGVHADFTGSSPQVNAPLNAGPAIAPTSVLTVLKSFLDPSGPINSGTLRAIRVTAPEGTIVNARPPAPCGGLNEVRFACDAAVMGALGQVIPERLTGDVRGTSNHTYIGGRDFIFYEYPSGGTGAFARSDGNNAVRAFNEGENVSIQSAEIVEAIFPLRIRRNEIRPDSGGPGRFRGGCGLVREVEVLSDRAYLSVLSDRNIVPPAGVNGGFSGAPNRYRVRRGNDYIEPSSFPGKIANFPLARGDVVVMESSGGGGFGNPKERCAEALNADLNDGYVTQSGAAQYKAAPLIVDCIPDSGLQTSQCLLSAAAADALRASYGDLCEIVRQEGPSIRLWVAGIGASLDVNQISLAPSLSVNGAAALHVLSRYGRQDA